MRLSEPSTAPGRRATLDDISDADLDLPFAEVGNRTVRLGDSPGSACSTRDGNELLERGLYLGIPAWSGHAFDLEII